MRHYNKTRNIKRKLKHMTRRIKKGRTSRLLFKSKVLGKQLRKLSKKFIQRGGLRQKGGAVEMGNQSDWMTPDAAAAREAADTPADETTPDGLPVWAQDPPPAPPAAPSTKRLGWRARLPSTFRPPRPANPDAPVPPVAAGGDDEDGTPADAPVDQPTTADAGATGTTPQSRSRMLRKAAAKTTGWSGAFSRRRSPAAGVPAQPPSAPAAGSAPETFVIPKNTYTQKLLQTLRDNDLTVEKPMGGQAVWDERTATLLGGMEFTRDELVPPTGQTNAADGPTLGEITDAFNTMGDQPPTTMGDQPPTGTRDPSLLTPADVASGAGDGEVVRTPTSMA